MAAIHRLAKFPTFLSEAAELREHCRPNHLQCRLNLLPIE
jgi:hypothetical protein